MLDDKVGLGDGFCGRRLVAGLVEVGEVVAALVPHRRRVRRNRFFDRRRRRQAFVLGLDQLGGVLRLVERLGNDHRHRLADEAHAVAREQRHRRGELRRAVAALARLLRLLQAEREHGRVVAGQDVEHARRLPRALHVDRDELGVRVLGTHHIGARLVDQADVVDIAAVAAHEIRVFFPRDRLANSKFTHDVLKRSVGRECAKLRMRRSVSRHCFRGSRPVKFVRLR